MAARLWRLDWQRPPDWLWRALIFLIALGLLVLITTRWNNWQADSTWQSTDDAYLQSDLTPIAARVSGYVRSMPVEDFQHVRSGELIAEIVDDDYRAGVAQLIASVAAANAQIEDLRAQQELRVSTRAPGLPLPRRPHKCSSPPSRSGSGRCSERAVCCSRPPLHSP